MTVIFDLDGCLACPEHRRHFVDPTKANCELLPDGKWYYKDVMLMSHPPQRKRFIPEWKSFFEACDKDEPILPVIEVIRSLHSLDYYGKQLDVHIWSGRCESVRFKTENWLDNNGITYNSLKMRPIGDNTPDEVLKERWLNERCADLLTPGLENPIRHDIEFVFDDRPKVVRMWQRRGIFVFNCLQGDHEF